MWYLAKIAIIPVCFDAGKREVDVVLLDVMIVSRSLKPKFLELWMEDDCRVVGC
jgi:hypothetical protein